MALPESPGHPPAGIQSVVWADPHIGGEHGFVEFVRVVDDEATLLVTASEPSTSPLEAWRPMLEDLGSGDSYEWTVASAAWAAEWAANTQHPYVNMSDALRKTYPPFAVDPQTPWPATDGQHAMPRLAKPGVGAGQPWNPPTSITLAPAASLSIGLRLQLASGGPRTRDAALSAMGAPVLRAVPGYALPVGLESARLYVRPPAGTHVRSVAAEPTAGVSASLAFRALAPGGGEAVSGGGGPPSTAHDEAYAAFQVVAKGFGRLRARVTFSDGTSVSVHYFLLPPLAEQVTALGAHYADTAWLPREFVDPFGRSASVMPWDRSPCGDNGAPCGHVLNDARAYDVGLSDDAGGGNPLGFASKVRAMPTAHEAARVDEYIQWTLYGVKPDTAKPPLRTQPTLPPSPPALCYPFLCYPFLLRRPSLPPSLALSRPWPLIAALLTRVHALRVAVAVGVDAPACNASLARGGRLVADPGGRSCARRRRRRERRWHSHDDVLL